MTADTPGQYKKPWAGVVVVLLFLLGIEQFIEHIVRDRDRQHQANHVLNDLSTARAKLEGIINSNLLALQGLAAVIAVHPEMNQDEFSRISKEIVGSKHALRNIAGAPDLVISLMYPLEGNEKALGLDYRTHPTQSAAAMRAVEERKMILAGPLDLVQGGHGIIARAPVFIGSESGSESRRLWGIISSVLDADTLFRNAGLLETTASIRVAIRGVDGTGRNGSVFFGNPDIFDRSPVTQEVTLPTGSWFMAAEPAVGWQVTSPLILAVRLSSILIALLFASVIYFRLRSAVERRQSKAALHERESILESVFQSLPDLYFRMDLEGTILDYRAQHESDLYVPPERFIGRRMQDVLPPDLGRLFSEKMDLVKKTDGMVTYEYDILINDELRHFEARLTRQEGDEQLVVVVRDVEEQYHAKMVIKQSEKSYRELFESTGTAMCLISGDGTLSLVNARFTMMSGKMKQSLEGKVKFTDFVHPEDRELVSHYLQNMDTTSSKLSPTTFEFRYGSSQQQPGWGLAMITSVPDTGDSIVSIIDITSRKNMERNLQSELNQKRQILDTTMDGYVLTDGQGNIIAVNAAYCEIVAYTREELLSMNIRELDSKMSDTEMDQRVRNLLQVGHMRFETKHKHKNGSDVELEVSASIMPGEDEPLVVVFLRDITARKLAEEALNRSQKMDAIGQLTGGIAHDFNNILGIIIGNLGLLKQLAVEEKVLKRVETANKAALRAADLTKQLLGFSRKKAHNTLPAKLSQLIEDMDSLIARTVTPEVELELRLSDDLWLTKIDPGDFQDALLNLILNARDAMPKGGRLTIDASNRLLDSASMAVNTTLIPGEYVELMISDTGVGIEADNLYRIFEPFYTTKPQGEGTGLGMSMVFGFVERSKGYIKATSEPGHGTKICIYLPRCAEVVKSSEHQNKTVSNLPGGSETILVVDDEEDLLEIAEAYLQDLGYHTITAQGAQQAMQRLTDTPGIDVLFSDVLMPGGINGYELAEQAIVLQPAIKVLLTSGFTKKAAADNDRTRFVLNLLRKPYLKADLAHKLREVLEGNHILKQG